ncbi:hypothetical protein DFJ74DRAFT_305956 [Hyaloraphidium curvatum]|nr:hypothetical protein DFJ74DRAFT_305956 [Hyaloraphidium curvatum]
MPFDLDAYLARVSLPGPLEPDLPTLHSLVLRHALSIPFENIDAVLGRTPDLSAAGLQEKMVRRRRGGWCHEHTLLLKLALDAVGYSTRIALARARWRVEEGRDVPRAHSALFVRLPMENCHGECDEYLVEVAYGSLRLSAPLVLEEGLVQETMHGTCRLVREEGGWVLQVQRNDGWADVWIAEDAPVTVADLEVVNFFQSNKRGEAIREDVNVAIGLEGGGRMVLSDGKLTTTEGDSKTVEPVRTAEDLERALERIGVDVGGDVWRQTLRRGLHMPLPDGNGARRPVRGEVPADELLYG